MLYITFFSFILFLLVLESPTKDKTNATCTKFLTELSDDLSFEERLTEPVHLRMLIWQNMESFADLAESKSRFLSDMVLDLAE